MSLFTSPGSGATACQPNAQLSLHWFARKNRHSFSSERSQACLLRSISHTNQTAIYFLPVITLLRPVYLFVLCSNWHQLHYFPGSRRLLFLAQTKCFSFYLPMSCLQTRKRKHRTSARAPSSKHLLDTMNVNVSDCRFTTSGFSPVKKPSYRLSCRRKFSSERSKNTNSDDTMSSDIEVWSSLITFF